MSQTVSVTEARDNFPALVRQVAEQDEPLVVTSRSQPRVVLVRWETYQHQQSLQTEGALYRLESIVAELENTAAVLAEAFEPDSLTLTQSVQELSTLARDAWTVCRLLDKPRRHLASILADALLNLTKSDKQLTQSQLTQLINIFPLLRKGDLTNELVTKVDLALATAGLNSLFPLGDELGPLYQRGSES
ncbi:type II toxin-antitoxin system Phd/YefM family antitoxin [Chloroflexi bacterium TSY]|nr:type II toxin-antitoxin system Phd/YefM family antitoxin [Chloroflexi bacterium TSY]